MILNDKNPEHLWVSVRVVVDHDHAGGALLYRYLEGLPWAYAGAGPSADGDEFDEQQLMVRGQADKPKMFLTPIDLFFP